MKILIKDFKPGDSGQVKEVYIKKINSHWQVVVKTDSGDFYWPNRVINTYRWARRLLYAIRQDLKLYGYNFEINVWRDINLHR